MKREKVNSEFCFWPCDHEREEGKIRGERKKRIF